MLQMHLEQPQSKGKATEGSDPSEIKVLIKLTSWVVVHFGGPMIY